MSTLLIVYAVDESLVDKDVRAMAGAIDIEGMGHTAKEAFRLASERGEPVLSVMRFDPEQGRPA